MGEDELKASQEQTPPELSVDLLQVRTVAEQTYDTLLAELPQLLPWSKFVSDVASTDSAATSLFQSIQANAKRLLDIPTLSWIGKRGIQEAGNMASLQEWRASNIAKIAQDLQSIGIPATAEMLEAPLPGDSAYRAVHDTFFRKGKDPEEGLLDILASVQREVVGTGYGTRVVQEMDVIMEACAPEIPELTGDVLAYASIRSDRGFQENGGWLLLPSGKHVVIIFEPLADLDNYQRYIQQADLITTGDRADKFYLITHEKLGHGGLAELFDPTEAQEALGMANRTQEVRLTGTLTEGYAMILEELAAEISYSEMLGEDAVWVDRGLATLQRRRSEGLVQEQYEKKGSVYKDGFTLMKTLMQQMNIYELPSVERIMKLREFLSTIDIIEAANLGVDDPRYEQIITDPYNNLPLKKKDS